jgi:prevent-host-death family protein
MPRYYCYGNNRVGITRWPDWNLRDGVSALSWTIQWSIWWIETKGRSRGQQMRISVSEAKGQLTELVRRAEAGDEIILTRHGQPAVRLVAVRPVPKRKARRQLLEAARASEAIKATAGPRAARSQDFLYDDEGLPH